MSDVGSELYYRDVASQTVNEALELCEQARDEDFPMLPAWLRNRYGDVLQAVIEDLRMIDRGLAHDEPDPGPS